MKNYLLKIIFIRGERFNISRICVLIVFLVLRLINAGLIITIILWFTNVYEEGEFSSAIASLLISNFESLSISNFYLMNLNSDELYSLRKLKESFQLIPVNFGSSSGVCFDWYYIFQKGIT